MKVLVTGGGGFLGGAVVRQLLDAGHAVSSFSRSAYPHLHEHGVEHRQGDLGDAEAVRAAVRGHDAVIHTAARAGVWGAFESYWRANLIGTANIVRACRREGVGKLVHTSTPSVAHSGGDLEGVDESTPTGIHLKTAYQISKAAAERLVLAASGTELATCALRPHLIFGPGDPHLVPRVLARSKRGAIVLPGGGHKNVDTTYVDNAAEAHLAALDSLAPDHPCAGQAYFISNGEPRPMRDVVRGVVRGATGREIRVVGVPTSLAMGIAGLLEAGYGWLGWTEREPAFTRFVVEQLSTAHHFDLSRARRDLGWSPRVRLDEGFQRLGEGTEAPAGA